MKVDDEYQKMEAAFSEHHIDKDDEYRCIRGVWNYHVKQFLTENARREEISSEQYRGRLFVARKVMRELHEALHSYPSPDKKQQPEFWSHQEINFVSPWGESRKYKIDRRALSYVTAEYICHPEIQNDATDWYFMDALVFSELDAFAYQLQLTGPRDVIWAWKFAKQGLVKYGLYDVFFWFFRFGLAYILSPVIAIYLRLNGHEGFAFGVGGIWLLYVILDLISLPAHRRAKRKFEQLLELLVNTYADLVVSNVISPTRFRAMIHKAAEAGVVFDGALFAIVDRAINREPTAFVPFFSCASPPF